MLPRPIIAIAVIAALVLQDGSAQNTTSSSSSSPTVTWTPSSSSLSQVLQSTPSQTVSPTTASVSTLAVSTGSTRAGGSVSVTSSPTSAVALTSVTTTAVPLNRTCGSVTLLWEKAWNGSYEANEQFVNETTKKLEELLEGVDSTTYQGVKVSGLTVTEGDGGTSLKFTLCLVVKNNNAGDIEDVLKKVQTIDNKDVTGHVFVMTGVTFNDWRAKEGQCKVCSGGGGGPFTIERTCTPNKGYSCRGAKTTKQSKDCVKYCSPDSAAAAKRISSFILVLGIILSFSFDF